MPIAEEQDVGVIAGQPSHVQVPETVQQLIAGRAYSVVWQNERGGLTFEVATVCSGREFIKWAPTGSGLDLTPRSCPDGLGVAGDPRPARHRQRDRRRPAAWSLRTWVARPRRMDGDDNQPTWRVTTGRRRIAELSRG